MADRWEFGRELRAARSRAGLSIRRAAKLAGVSEGRWRQLESGVQSVGGVPVAIRTKPETAVKVAAVVALPADRALTLAGFDPKVHMPASGDPSEDERLVARLVQAAADGLRSGNFVDPDDGTIARFHGHDRWPDSNIRHWTTPDVPGRMVVTAVLRALAEVLEAERRDYASITRLERLASVVEKGEQAR